MITAILTNETVVYIKEDKLCINALMQKNTKKKKYAYLYNRNSTLSAKETICINSLDIA